MFERKYSILVIDDERGMLLILKRILEQAEFVVLTASDAQEGERLARAYQPDLILCDVMMPQVSGFQLRVMLSKETQTTSIPFIFLTARDSQSDRIFGFTVGADDYIVKPFNRDELLARIRAVLRRHEIGRQQGLQEAGEQSEDI